MELASLLMARSRRHRVHDYPGALSVKSVVQGCVSWHVGARRLDVRPGSYLVLNDGQPYSLDIDEPEPVETFCVFFRRGVVEQAAQPVVRMLDDPGRMEPLLFPLRVQGEGNAVTPLLTRLRREALTGHNTDRAENALIEAVAGLHQLPALRWSTRDELLRRVLAGREYLESCTARPVPLEEAARAACLSPFHFQRVFSSVFRESPHAYALRRRVESACAALVRDNDPITHIAQMHGFGTSASFSTAVRKHFGVAPSQIRKIGKAPSPPAKVGSTNES